MKVYGITTCDSVKKTRQFLDAHAVAYDFVNFKQTPPTEAQLESWFAVFGDKLVNKHSKTYREQAAAAKAAQAAGEKALIQLLIAQPLMVKRPVIEKDGQPVLLGWQEAALAELLAK